jgi:glutamate 5-kinase
MKRDLTVVKVGTGVLTKVSDGTLDGSALVRLATALAGRIEAGERLILVSSGAVGAGVAAFGLAQYPAELATKQACAAVGQTRLMAAYENIFRNFEIAVAQLLLTAADIRTEERKVLVVNTLRRLLREPRLLPIINENDSVAVEELKFGDNDMLSARVAQLAGARRLIILTSVDGLLDPATGAPVAVVDDVARAESLVSDQKGKFSIGGMGSKLAAVRCAVEAGIETVIANGRKPEQLAEIMDGRGVATRFPVCRHAGGAGHGGVPT